MSYFDLVQLLRGHRCTWIMNIPTSCNCYTSEDRKVPINFIQVEIGQVITDGTHGLHETARFALAMGALKKGDEINYSRGTIPFFTGTGVC